MDIRRNVVFTTNFETGNRVYSFKVAKSGLGTEIMVYDQFKPEDTAGITVGKTALADFILALIELKAALDAEGA